MKVFRFSLFAALVCALALSAAARDVTFDVQPRLLHLGETAHATLTFIGARSVPQIQFPPVDGLQITGTGQQVHFGTGGSQVSLTYTLFPQKTGPITIGPYEFQWNGETIRIPEVTLEVRPRGEARADGEQKMLLVRLELPEQPPYLHQVFDLTLKLYALPGVQLTQDVQLLGGLPESGFVIGNFEELQMTREDLDGQLYTVRRFRARARGMTAGTFHIEPALRVGVVDPNQRRQRRDIFDGFFDPFGGPVATPVNLGVPGVDLTVRAIPSDGRPADFAGAVGAFHFDADVRPREVSVGQPLTITLRLQGSGNIAAALPPSYRDSDGYKAYEARQTGDTPEPAAERGVKVFEQVVIPRSESLRELPALQFSYFDPATEQYQTIQVGPFPITVHPSVTGADSLMLQVPGQTIAGGGALVLGSDIIYLKPAPAHWRKNGSSTARQTIILGAHVAAPLILAGLLLVTRRRNRLASNIALARRQKAPRSARAKLNEAARALKTGGEASAVFAALTAAVADYFGHRLNLPPGAVEPPLILVRLQQANASEEILNQWREVFSIFEQVRYASRDSFTPDALRQWLDTTTSLLRQAERIKL